MAQEPNAILAINSLDRYAGQPVSNWNRFRAQVIQTTRILNLLPSAPYAGFPIVGGQLTGAGLDDGTVVVSVTGLVVIINKPAIADAANSIITQQSTTSSAQQPVSNSLNSQYTDTTPYSHNFSIQSPNALVYGYITKIIISQVQIQYNIPTINVGLNDTFYIADGTRNILPEPVVIPYGFYYPDELAATIQILIGQTQIGALANITVVFFPRLGFIFRSTSVPPRTFYFPEIVELQLRPGLLIGPRTINNILKTYKTLGITLGNSYREPLPFAITAQISTDYPNFLYTPYIDIYSDVLTNYQTVKDTNTSVSKPKGLIARIYVSGGGNVQTTTGMADTLGSRPFVLVTDLNSPKIIRWSPSVAVPSIDFQLLDQYGDLLPGSVDLSTGAALGFNTEFQMTMLCIEGQ